MIRLVEFLKKNAVLIKFYLLFAYFWLFFTILIKIPRTSEFINEHIPVFMAKSVALVLKIFGLTAKTIGPNVQIISDSEKFGFKIILACAGIFGMMIYTAAVIAYPSKIKEKIMGLIVGITGLYAINTIRMAALGIIGLKWRKQFEMAHEYLWQGIFIIFVIAFWIFWKEKMVQAPPKEIPPGTDQTPDESAS
ncbi:archaeosortase/exosortase family protein [bacterium]|nr:archaeosortase/exosortase family protein [candidate division CSSED10-310 bacterium]